MSNPTQAPTTTTITDIGVAMFTVNSDKHRSNLLSATYNAHGVMYSGPTTYPQMGANTRIWVHHMGYCG